MTPLIAIIILVIGLCVLFYFTKRQLIKSGINISNNVLNIYFNVIGVLYALVLAFILVTVWQNYKDTMTAVENEAHQLMDLRVEAVNLPEQYSNRVIAASIDYAQAVSRIEWQEMVNHSESELANQKMDDLLELRTELGAIEASEVSKCIKNLREYRHARLLSSHAQLPNSLWGVLIAGSIICLLLSFLIHVKDILWQAILTALMTSVFSMVLFLIFSLSNPFEGAAKIPSDSFDEIELGKHMNYE